MLTRPEVGLLKWTSLSRHEVWSQWVTPKPSNAASSRSRKPRGLSGARRQASTATSRPDFSTPSISPLDAHHRKKHRRTLHGQALHETSGAGREGACDACGSTRPPGRRESRRLSARPRQASRSLFGRRVTCYAFPSPRTSAPAAESAESSFPHRNRKPSF